MPEIPIGARNATHIEVTDSIAISFLADEAARVLATPWLIAHLEMTARDSVKPYLLDAEDTVGTQVNVRHVAATPMGMKVTFESVITEVEGKRVRFRVSAWDEREKIAEGSHERAIINIARFAERVQAKKR